ncbi:MAG: DNA polymerase [Candidatus Aenigmatarchaeota archaeon]
MPEIKHTLGNSQEKNKHYEDNIVFLDTETVADSNNKDIQKLLFGFAEFWQLQENGEYIEKSNLLFRTNDEFWKYIIDISNSLNKKFPLTIMSFNANFDFSVLEIAKYFKKYNIKVENFITDYHKFNINAITAKKHKITILDGVNYFNGISLRELGNVLGIQKLTPKNNDYENMQFNEENVNYCKQDVKILREAIFYFLKFLKTHNLGSLKITLASQSFNAFIKNYLKEEIEINHSNKEVIKMERESYFGGKTDINWKGLYPNHVTTLDYNSLYPSVMLNNKFPTKLLYVENHIPVEKFLEKLKNDDIGCVARLNVTMTTKPLVPYRLNGKLIFIYAENLDVTLNKVDIEFLLKNGMIINSVEKVAWYEVKQIFKDFVNTLYNLRLKYKKEGNTAMAYLTKIFLNSCYGKFGQSKIQKYNIRNNTEDFNGIDMSNSRYTILLTKELFKTYTNKKLDTEKMLDSKTYNGEKYIFKVIKFFDEYFFVNNTKEEAFNSFPLIASYVTSYGRQKLQEAIDIIPNNEWLYADTDSVTFDSKYLHLFEEKGLIGDELGKLKVEHSGIAMQINNPKDYIIFNDELNNGNDIIKIKGVSKTAIKTGENIYKQLQFGSLKTVLKQSLDGASVKYIEKQISDNYKKGYYDKENTGFNIFHYKIVDKVESKNGVISHVFEILNSKDNSVLKRIVDGNVEIDLLKNLK